MTILLRAVSAALLLLAGFDLAHAGEAGSRTDQNEFYISVSSGLTFPLDTHWQSSGTTGELRMDRPGFVGSTAIGRQISDRWRSEIELAVHEANIDTIKINGFGIIGVNGDATIVSALGKVAYDFDIGKLHPYISAGIGIANYQVSFNSPITGSDNKTVLAGEAGGGFTLPLTEAMDLFTSTNCLVLSNLTIDPTGGGSAELKHPLVISSEIGLRLHF